MLRIVRQPVILVSGSVGDPESDKEAKHDNPSEGTDVGETEYLHERASLAEVKVRNLVVVLFHLGVVVLGDEVTAADFKLVLPAHPHCHSDEGQANQD